MITHELHPALHQLRRKKRNTLSNVVIVFVLATLSNGKVIKLRLNIESNSLNVNQTHSDVVVSMTYKMHPRS